ncbi:MAG TPA: glycosyltransferase family 87 protein [Bacteroidota bacterium]|nr:glycosyltransferase family 87 protein [Bacteroidota bacterium]
MKKIAKPLLIAAGYAFLAYHFVVNVFTPTFFPDEQHLVNDFGTYYVASRWIAEGEVPYRSEDNHHSVRLTTGELAAWQMNKAVIPAYVYPSPLAIALMPLSRLPFAEARLLWSSFCMVCFLGCISLTFYLLNRRPSFDVTTLLIFAVFLGSMPTLESFTLGQVNYPVLLLVLLSFTFHVRKAPLLSGGALAVATLIKVSPGFLLLYFIWKKDLRAVAGFILVICISAIPMLLIAPSVDFAFFKEILPALGGGTPELNNKALAVWWQFSFLNNELATPIAHLPIVATMLSVLCSALVICSIVIVFNRSKGIDAINPSTVALLRFLLCCTGALLAQPYVEIHHLVFAFPALAGMIAILSPNAERWRNLGRLVIVFFLLNSRGENSFRWLGPNWYGAFFSNPQAYGLLLIFITAGLILTGNIPISPESAARAEK